MHSETSKITVIVLLYNDMPHGLRAVESVISQSYGNFKLIIDKTLEMLPREIGRAIIDDDKFEIPVALQKNTLDCAQAERHIIVQQNDNGNFGRFRMHYLGVF